MSGPVLVGILVGVGAYLIFQRGIVRIALGFVLVAHAINLLLILSGGTARRGAPIVGAGGTPADPLPQAFVLTAVVISFSVTAFLLGLAFRNRSFAEDDDTERS